jgi:hypothetical protein
MLFFVVVIITLGIFLITRPKKDSGSVIIDSSALVPYLKDGDLILRLGDGALSPAFTNVSLTDKRFSHLGIVRIRGGKISIISSVGSILKKEKGVEEESLDKFLYGAKTIGVFRIKFMGETAIPAVSDKAVEYINVPFDWNFDLNDESKIYCTELLYVVLKYAAPGFTLSTMYFDKLGKDIIPLDSISNSPDFEEIIYIK